ncbi:MAG: tetratricopeptide repeat protein [Rhodospirillales bacterium]|nr:tetratricopeptide repeat protein [Rhodospirillales bacterium]
MSGSENHILQRAAALYARGNLRGAEGLCQRLLAIHPDHPDGLHILGLVAWRRDDRARAIQEIRKAISSDPQRPQPHNSLGVLLKESGDIDGAEVAFRAAVGLQPKYPEALTNLGNILCETGRLGDAEATHRRVVELAPSYAEGHNNLATALARQERWDQAIKECRLAVKLEPARTEFQLNLGNSLSAMKEWEEAAEVLRRAVDSVPETADAHANLGIALYHLDRLAEAEAAHHVATQLRPESARFWANLGAAQADLERPDAALQSCQKAIDLDPSLPEAHNCLSLALKLKGKTSEAAAACETAIRLRPNYHKAYSNLGTILHSQGRFAEALAAYVKALSIMPDYAEALWNKGMLHLLLGDFESGWRGYEFGLDIKRGRARYRHDQFEPWQGAAIAGKTIVVSGEQGVGDQIMFASLLPDLVERGAICLVKLEPRLYPLLDRSISGLTLIPRDGGEVSRIEHLDVDYQTPIGGLCRWLRPDLASFPSRQGYLRADQTQIEEIRHRYRDRLGDRPLVGVSWRGGSGEARNIRSIPLAAWSPILNQREFGFVNLQYGDCRADLAAVQGQTGVEVLHDERVDPLKSLDDFAAQTAAMDLVISIDNSTVHMAGALNVPVWAMLPFVPDWRWLLHRNDSHGIRVCACSASPATANGHL